MDNKNKIPISLIAFNGILVMGIIFVVFLIYGSIHEPKKIVSTKTDPTVVTTHAFDNVVLQAKAAYVLDVAQNKIIYEKNGTAQLPLASLTKIMTALTAADLLPKDSKITIQKEFLEEDGDNGLVAQETWKLKDLLDFSLVVSSNDGARSIASVIGATILKTDDYNLGRKDFIEKMNEKAKDLGLNQTYFINESGLDEGTVSGGYGSAEDVAKLVKYIISTHGTLLEATKEKKETFSSFSIKHTAQNTNLDIDKVPGILASKTGYTKLAGGNLVMAFDVSIGRPIIAVILGSTQEGRFTDMEALTKASLDYLQTE